MKSVQEIQNLQIPRGQPQIRASPGFGFAGFTDLDLRVAASNIDGMGASAVRQLGGTSGDNWGIR